MTDTVVTPGSPAYFVMNKKSRGFPSPAHAGFGPCCFLMVTSSLFAPLTIPPLCLVCLMVGSLFSAAASLWYVSLYFLCETNQVRRVQDCAQYCKRKNHAVSISVVRKCEYPMVSCTYEKESKGNRIGLPLLLLGPSAYALFCFHARPIASAERMASATISAVTVNGSL